MNNNNLDLAREGKIHVFHLSDIEGEQNEDIVRNRTEYKQYTLEATKGEVVRMKFIVHDL